MQTSTGPPHANLVVFTQTALFLELAVVYGIPRRALTFLVFLAKSFWDRRSRFWCVILIALNRTHSLKIMKACKSRKFCDRRFSILFRASHTSYPPPLAARSWWIIVYDESSLGLYALPHGVNPSLPSLAFVRNLSTSISASGSRQHISISFEREKVYTQ